MYQPLSFMMSLSATQNTQQKTQTETGRSMVEILAVLAVMAVIAIGGIIGYKYAMDKNAANTIVHDAYLGYTSMRGSKTELMDWTPVNFTPKCGKPIDVSRDVDGDDYVRVQEIEHDVCQQILLMAVPGKLMLYDEEGEDFTECEEDNTIIFAFDGTRAPGVNCDSGDDCGKEGVGMYCNMDKGVCRFCPEDGYVTSPNNDACWPVCDEDTETTCMTDRDHWCCANTLLCGEKVGECIESDGYCEYSLRDQTKETESDCSYSYQNQTSVRYAECSYNYTNQTNERYAECSYASSGTGENFSMTQLQGCPSGQYCYLAYKNDDCSTTLGAEGASIMYGTCTSLAMTNPSCRIRTMGGVLSVREGCPAGQYCYLAYQDADCAQTLGAEGASIMYGACTSLAMTNPTCRIKELSGVLTPLKKCPGDQYCYLAYSDDSCTKTLGAEGASTMYGACTSLAMTNPTCPIKSLDTNILNAVKPCPGIHYCYLKYASSDCSDEVGATGANPFYGVCLPRDSNKVVCPVEDYNAAQK